MKENTRKILNDLAAAGLDVSSIEAQIQRSPLLDRQADTIIGDGILRQQEYSRYMNDLVTKERNLQTQLNQLASLHDVQNSGVQLSAEQSAAIKKMEDALIATGEFEEESIRNLSRIAQTPAVKVNPPINPNPNNVNPNNNLNPNLNLNNPVVPQFQQPDLSNYVDANTFRSELANIAYGGIATNMLINSAIEEARELGIKIDRPELVKLQENLRNGYERGKGLDDIMEETFKVSEARQAKQQAEIDNQIKQQVQAGIAEGLKAAGVPDIKKFHANRRHPILDRKRTNPANIQTPQPDVPIVEGDTKAPPPVDTANLGNKLPVNKYGDVEVFRMRGNRESRMQAASGTFDKVMEHLANDPTYVE